MDSKLTLKLEKEVIEKAKFYAKSQHTSLSRLIENYLMTITSEEDQESITPLVKSLSGIIDLPEDEKEDYSDYLTKKYK
jgi:hypothetical protein